MLTTNEFENLISKPEGSTLDFKKKIYDFRSNSEESAKFIKDVISFSNTIRNESSYIIFGIKDKPDGTLDLIGLTGVNGASYLVIGNSKTP
uniref:AlbA family DNA-binding domain-containing protein n=1 Tax=Zunongwangia profunda TaxID=398743 RepID=UPI0030D934FC